MTIHSIFLAFALIALAQLKVWAQGEGPVISPSHGPVFATPPSYLETLRANAAPLSLGSLPRLQKNRLDDHDQREPAQQLIQEDNLEKATGKATKGQSAPSPVRIHQTSLSLETPPNHLGVTLKGFTVKDGKIKLKSASANGPGGLNNKWLELDERQRIEESTFEPPGAIPREITIY